MREGHRAHQFNATENSLLKSVLANLACLGGLAVISLQNKFAAFNFTSSRFRYTAFRIFPRMLTRKINCQ
jgi:hypothetical protein